jgi:hypothetical protein
LNTVDQLFPKNLKNQNYFKAKLSTMKETNSNELLTLT